MIDIGDKIERSQLILLSKRNLASQAKNIKADIARDQEYIAEKVEAFQKRVPTEKEQEYLDERRERVGNLSVILLSIELVQELLDKEQKRLQQAPSLWGESEVG